MEYVTVQSVLFIKPHCVPIMAELLQKDILEDEELGMDQENRLDVEQMIELLEKQERTAEAVALCRRAIHIEPYQEDLYEHLMRGLLRTGDMKGAMSVYEEMSELLLAHFGVMPSETLRTLYRQATRTVNDRTLTMDEVCSQLAEPAPHRRAQGSE